MYDGLLAQSFNAIRVTLPTGFQGPTTSQAASHDRLFSNYHVHTASASDLGAWRSLCRVWVREIVEEASTKLQVTVRGNQSATWRSAPLGRGAAMRMNAFCYVSTSFSSRFSLVLQIPASGNCWWKRSLQASPYRHPAAPPTTAHLLHVEAPCSQRKSRPRRFAPLKHNPVGYAQARALAKTTTQSDLRQP
jgi:hypothetical protein